MRPKKKILLVGCGNLGTSLLNVWKENYDITVIEKNKSRTNFLKKNNFCLLNLEECKIINFDFVILSIKPKDFSVVGKILSEKMGNGIILSFMAGIEVKFIKKILNTNLPICRVMPNLFSGLGLGVNGVFLKQKDISKKINIENLVKPLGEIVWLPSESDLDFFTAFFGGAPAYFFYYLEIMSKIVSKKKIYTKNSKLYITKILEGTINYLKQEDYNFQKHISLVASKGGTTEEAIKVLKNKNQLFNLLNKSIGLATKKSMTLRKKK